jgi:hypothetical protein
LGSYLGISITEIEKNLTIKVLSFFKERNGTLTCPELDSYKAMLHQRKEKIVNGGRNGGKTTQAKNKTLKGIIEGNLVDNLKALRREEMSRDESNKDEKKSLNKDITKEERDAWVTDYDSSPECSLSYLKASNGY